MQEDLRVVIEELQSSRDLLRASETDVKHFVIMQFVTLLGWNQFNEVKPEYSVGTEEKGRVDYSLQINGSNKVFLEAKAGNENLRGHQEQLVVYTAKHGVQLAVLTNGHRWWFYLPLEEGPWEPKKFCEIDLRAQGPSEVASELSVFLSREDVHTGAAVEEAKARLAKLQSEREIDEYLPKAWGSLVSDTNSLLFDLIAETVEKGCGHKPGSDRIQRFLKETNRPEPQQPPVLPIVQMETGGKKANLTFDMVEIPVGAKLQFVDNPQIECEVIDNKRVLFKGRSSTLSGSATELKGTTHGVRGSLFWVYEGETIQQRRERLEK